MEKLFHQIEQVAFVVSDLEKAIAVVTDELGIDPVIQVNFGKKKGDEAFNKQAASIENVYLDGRYTGSYAIRLGVCDLKGGMQIELIEPLEGPSIFQQYLEEHGPGGQHLAVDNGCSYPEMIGRMGAAGNPLGQVAVVDGQEDCAFVKHTYTLGTALELHQRGPDWAPPSGLPPMVHADRTKRPAALTDTILGISIASTEPERVRQLLEERYGIGPWTAAEENGLRTWRCKALNTELEILTPLSEEHPAAAWLRQNKGPGIYRVTMNCLCNLEQAVELFRADGRTVTYEDALHTAAEIDYTEILGAYLRLRKD